MKPAVLGNFRRYTRPLEGNVPWLYLDVEGAPTTGNGFIVLTPNDSKKLPWVRRSDRQLATPMEIEAEWRRIKARPDLAKAGALEAGKVAQLYLPDPAIGAMTRERLLANEKAIVAAARISNWAEWPADAQLGLMSLCWIGVGTVLGKFPKFLAAAREMDFATCSLECDIDATGNPGIPARNVAQRLCFRHAVRVVREDLDREYLNYPDPLKEAA